MVDSVKIYSTQSHGPVGEMEEQVRGTVHIHLDASYWPDRIRDEKKGLQFLGEFHSFENFKNSGSFDDLSLSDVDEQEDAYMDWYLGSGIYP